MTDPTSVWPGAHGEQKDLTNLLLEFADNPNFIDYPDESNKVTDARLDEESACKPHHTKILGKLRNLQKNLSFAKTNVEQAMLDIAAKKKFKFIGSEKKIWKEVLTRRLRNLCRVVAQNDAKAKPPRWISAMPWRSQPPSESTSAEQETGYLNFEYGYDAEVNLGWRRASPQSRKKPSLPLVHDPQEDPDAPIIAKWDDGSEHSIPLTQGQLADFGAAKEKAKSAGTLWTMQQEGTNHTLVIKQQVDRRLLIVLREQSKQVLQMNVRDFGEVEDETRQLPGDDPTLVKALAQMTIIGELYAANKIERCQLKEKKGELKKEKRKSKSKQATTKQGLMKRPSSKAAAPDPVHTTKMAKRDNTTSAETQDDDTEHEDSLDFAKPPVQDAVDVFETLEASLISL